MQCYTVYFIWKLLYMFRVVADSLRAGLGWNSFILILLASCQETCMTYTICCAYSEELLMMGRGTVRNM